VLNIKQYYKLSDWWVYDRLAEKISSLGKLQEVVIHIINYPESETRKSRNWTQKIRKDIKVTLQHFN